MKTLKRLPDAELAVMQTLWKANGEMTSAQVQQELWEKYGWKTTSVLTFLSRLAEKGFVISRREGKANRYWARIQEKEYLKSESVSFVQRLYAGSIKNLVASLTDAGAVTQQDLEELRAFLDKQEGEP